MNDKNNELDFSDAIRAQLKEAEGTEEEVTQEAWAAEEKKGKKLNKPFRTSGGPKKFSVYVKNEKGNVVKVNFGDPNMEIKRDNPARRKSFAHVTDAIIQDPRLRQNTGVAKCGARRASQK